MVEIVLDWRAYFREFCHVHGGDPVAFEGRLLFRTGAMYSATDHAGPEWRPPEGDPKRLAHLKRYYWARRRAVLEQQRVTLARTVEGLEADQAFRTAPLQQVVRYVDEETGRVVRQAHAVNVADLKMAVRLLTEDVAECDAHLKEANSDAA